MIYGFEKRGFGFVGSNFCVAVYRARYGLVINLLVLSLHHLEPFTEILSSPRQQSAYQQPHPWSTSPNFSRHRGSKPHGHRHRRHRHQIQCRKRLTARLQLLVRNILEATSTASTKPAASPSPLSQRLNDVDTEVPSFSHDISLRPLPVAGSSKCRLNYHVSLHPTFHVRSRATDDTSRCPRCGDVRTRFFRLILLFVWLMTT